MGLPLLLHVFQASASDTIAVAPDRYGVDAGLELIVVHMQASEVNLKWPGVKVGVELDRVYRFQDPVGEVHMGTPYEVSGTGGERRTLYFTDLPVIHITTPHEIVDEPRVPARFRMASSDGGVEETPIGIEIRGATSQAYPKKSYRIEFWVDSLGSYTVDHRLLGMRSDDDWNLQAMYIQPLRLRCDLAHRLWMDIHRPYYAHLEPDAMSCVRTEYAELFINDRYMGLYAVGERVDRKQLQIKSFNGSVRGELYKGKDWGVPNMTEPPPPFNDGHTYWGGFELRYPKEVIEWGRLSSFIGHVLDADSTTFHGRYAEWFHMPNAVDYFLFLNLLRAKDNTGKNLFLAKYKQDEPYFYVPWDLDAVLGLAWDGALDAHVTEVLGNGMYDRLLTDCSRGGFVERAKSRWNELRAGPFTVGSIMQRFVETHERLTATGVYLREEMAWEDFTHDPAHLDYMADWLEGRLAYLDEVFSGYCLGTGQPETVMAPHGLRLFPNPASDHVTLVWDGMAAGSARVVITDALGRVVQQGDLHGDRTILDVSFLAAGLHHVMLFTDGASPVHGALIVR